MLDVYKKFYRLTDIPFRLSPDHRFSFGHHSYAEAKSYLEYAIFQGEGFITVTGPPGTGKTTLITEILSEVDKAHIQVAMVTSTQLDARDLMHMVAASFGLTFGDENKVTLLLALEKFLVGQHQKGIRNVLIVDEAQGLSTSALEELRLLANLQYQHRLLLQVCLVGQEQLRDVLAAPEQEHLRQRLIASAHLEPLDLDEVITYIEHRLCCVDWRGSPAITEQALRQIHQSSGGIPRKINLICNRMFIYAGLDEKHELTGEDAMAMVKELESENLLASEEAIKYSDTGEHNGDDVIRSLPRGEMLASEKLHSQPEPIPEPLQGWDDVQADIHSIAPDSVPSIVVEPHTQSNNVVVEPLPVQSTTPVAGDAPSVVAEEMPDLPKASRSKLLIAMILALVVVVVMFRLVTMLQQDRGSKVGQEQNVNDTVQHKYALPANSGQPMMSRQAEPQMPLKEESTNEQLIINDQSTLGESETDPVTDKSTDKPESEVAEQPVSEPEKDSVGEQSSSLSEQDTDEAPVDLRRDAELIVAEGQKNEAGDLIIPPVATSDDVAEKEKQRLRGQARQRFQTLSASLPEKSPSADLAVVETRTVSGVRDNSQWSSNSRGYRTYTADEIKAVLLSGYWNSDGKPADVLPSRVTFCNGDQQDISCWSTPQLSKKSNGQDFYKMESILSGFTGNGSFQLQYKRLVKSIDAEVKDSTGKGVLADGLWRPTVHNMTCNFIQPATVYCKDENAHTSEYHLSSLKH